MFRKISLLHATFHREGGVLPHIEEWFETAALPEQIDYVLGKDDDDAVDLLEDMPVRVFSGPPQPHSTAVRNWNGAASLAVGDILFVIADDLHPPKHWDVQLARFVFLDPTIYKYAIKIRDHPLDSDILLRHPIVSRAFYDRFGLFNPRFHGVFCDNDITARAFWRSFIFDARSISFDHRHPFLGENKKYSVSQVQQNRQDEYDFGRQQIESIWPAKLWRAPFTVVDEAKFRSFPRLKLSLLLKRCGSLLRVTYHRVIIRFFRALR